MAMSGGNALYELLVALEPYYVAIEAYAGPPMDLRLFFAAIKAAYARSTTGMLTSVVFLFAVSAASVVSVVSTKE
jgi:hypothetical protein